jgi:hypothetical protein
MRLILRLRRMTRSKVTVAVRVRMRVMMRVGRLNSKIHLRVNQIQMHFQEAHLISPY